MRRGAAESDAGIEEVVVIDAKIVFGHISSLVGVRERLNLFWVTCRYDVPSDVALLLEFHAFRLELLAAKVIRCLVSKLRPLSGTNGLGSLHWKEEVAMLAKRIFFEVIHRVS